MCVYTLQSSLILSNALLLNIKFKFTLNRKYFQITIKNENQFYFNKHPHLAEPPLPPIRSYLLLLLADYTPPPGGAEVLYG